MERFDVVVVVVVVFAVTVASSPQEFLPVSFSGWACPGVPAPLFALCSLHGHQVAASRALRVISSDVSRTSGMTLKDNASRLNFLFWGT